MNAALNISHWRSRLESKLPSGTAGEIARWIVELKVDFHISRPRKTKLGDFRPGDGKVRPRISVNSDLNSYQFLITTIHEFAHLGCYLKHGSRVNPHGKEWKDIYISLLGRFQGKAVFPEDLNKAITRHLSNPGASSCACPILQRALSKYDGEDSTFLSDLKPGTEFKLREQTFRILSKRRTRFLCVRLDDKKKYLISQMAKVEVISTVTP